MSDSELYNLNKNIIKHVQNNYGYWDEKEYCDKNGSIFLKITDININNIDENHISSIYSNYGIEGNNIKSNVI